jgi:RNA polymerase sigma-70 factor (ECF subfamily)
MENKREQDKRDDLVRRARRDREALGLLYDFYYPRIYRYCVRRLFHSETAEDVTSEVFLTMAREVRTFRGGTEMEFRHWLYAIATNQCNALVRKTLRREQLLAEAVQARQVGVRETTPDQQEFDWPVLYQGLLQLKPKQQTIITLRYFEKLTHNEIAAILDLKPTTVRVRCLRALGRLRTILLKIGIGDD